MVRLILLLIGILSSASAYAGCIQFLSKSSQWETDAKWFEVDGVYRIRGQQVGTWESNGRKYSLFVDHQGQLHFLSEKRGLEPLEVESFLQDPSGGVINDLSKEDAKAFLCTGNRGSFSKEIVQKIEKEARIANSNRAKNIGMCAISWTVLATYPGIAALRKEGVRNWITDHVSNFEFSLVGMSLLNECMSTWRADPALKRKWLALGALGTSAANFGTEFKSDDIIPGSQIHTTDKGDLISGHLGIVTYLAVAILAEQKYGFSLNKLCH